MRIRAIQNRDAGPSEKTLPDRIADELIARIFTGELRVGATLPAERALAAELGVDRTSLRMALRQLTRLKVLRPLRGSGSTVLDYRTHAGIDFLAAVLEVPGLELGSAFLIEAHDHWVMAMPAVTALAFARATPADVRALDDLFAEQLKALARRGGLHAAVDLEVAIQDAVIRLAGNTALDLLANSTRGLRRQLTRMLFELLDPQELVRKQRAQVRGVLEQRPSSEAVVEARRRALSAQAELLRRKLAALPPNPSRHARWSARAGALRAVPTRS